MSVNPSVARRSAARLVAVQVLYQMEMTGADVEQALSDDRDRRAEAPRRGPIAEPDSSLLGRIVRGVAADPTAYDQRIGAALTGDWTVERLEAVLRAILRGGAWELEARPQTPARVCISEWVDVAHAFYAGPEPGLVNAVLDRIGQHLRPQEMGRGG